MKTLLNTLMFCAILYITIVALFSIKNGTVHGPEWLINSSIITIAIYIAYSMTWLFSILFMPKDKFDTSNPPNRKDKLYLELSDCDGMCKFCNPDLKFKCETLKNLPHDNHQ